ncbi:thiolase family protein [Myceligenerans xiligouense]|uniref:Probable acetyl-CoA acetyltransferase n=1 Tax=Myceligenerans xiligouense TaxID=253184 RepID=A0A3N4ZI93_9MICO|nr:thiolase family protein [Myceligenerans xiligouense]RPF19621.1 acetyl-CoA acyltransferase [Myceligenerans xiligouense]
MRQAFVYDAVRTPFGRYGGGLAGARPDDLAAFVLEQQVARAQSLDPALVDDVILGNANGAGEDNRNVARMAVLLAGLPVTVPAVTLNRLCGSALDAAIQGARAIECGDADVVLAGGVESMSRAPWVVPKPDRGFPAGNLEMVSTTLGWRLTNDRMEPDWTVSMGEGTERLRERFGISRERQDEFALRSHRLAHEAWEAGRYDDLVVTYTGPGAGKEPPARDEPIRPGGTLEKLASLTPSFRPDGTITAANASPLTDGASVALLGSEAAADLTGLRPLARVAGRAAVAGEPQYFGYAPVEAANTALERSGITWDDVAAVELNEAFAAQSLACVDAWKIDEAIVNAWGGAIAVGHPLGASGTRVLGTLARRLRAEHARWGVAAICIGVGQGLAVVLENAEAGG